MKGILAILLGFSLMSFADDLKPGTNRVEFMHDKQPRKMLVRLPQDYNASKKYPVVFGFHGAGGPMEGYHRHLEELVKNHGYISVSPQGLSNAKGNKRSVTAWNGFKNHRFSSTDDVGFVVKTVDYLAKHASIDRARLYATGGSSGAIFCFRLAMETDLFAAIAPMRGAMIKRPPVPQKRPKLSILLVCGTEDALFTGQSKVPGEVFYPAQTTMKLWTENHGDKSAPVALEQTETVTLTRYSPEKATYEILLYAVNGSGHRLGRMQMTEAIGYMAKFFTRHTKPLAESKFKDQNQLELAAKKFFESFSKALEKQDATEAVMHIAPKYRERFSKGYRFWRGTKLRALKVIGLPDKEGVLRVKTQIVSPAGRKDTEIKKLLHIKGKWFLLER